MGSSAPSPIRPSRPRGSARPCCAAGVQRGSRAWWRVSGAAPPHRGLTDRSWDLLGSESCYQRCPTRPRRSRLALALAKRASGRAWSAAPRRPTRVHCARLSVAIETLATVTKALAARAAGWPWPAPLSCMEGHSESVAAAFHGCRSAQGLIARQRTPGPRPLRSSEAWASDARMQAIAAARERLRRTTTQGVESQGAQLSTARWAAASIWRRRYFLHPAGLPARRAMRRAAATGSVAVARLGR
jgi:hypothetical protein